jgi:hypothetical protein
MKNRKTLKHEGSLACRHAISYCLMQDTDVDDCFCGLWIHVVWCCWFLLYNFGWILLLGFVTLYFLRIWGKLVSRVFFFFFFLCVCVRE